MGFHRERAAAGLEPSGLTVVLWFWKKGLPWKFVFVLCCSVKLGFFFNSLCVWQCLQSSCFAHLPQSYVTWHWQIVFTCICSVVEAGVFLIVQWLRLECSYLFSGWGWIVLMCSVVQAGVFLLVQWLRLDCSYVFSGSGWSVLTCSVVQAGVFLCVQWFRLECSGWF